MRRTLSLSIVTLDATALARSQPIAPSRFVSHSPLKPGRRVLPVRSCCMAACLMARFLAISASNAPSNPSTSDNASAMARCSAEAGKREAASFEDLALRYVRMPRLRLDESRHELLSRRAANEVCKKRRVMTVECSDPQPKQTLLSSNALSIGSNDCQRVRHLQRLECHRIAGRLASRKARGLAHVAYDQTALRISVGQRVASLRWIADQ